MPRRLLNLVGVPLVIAVALLGVLRARPEFATLTPTVDKGFRWFAVVCAVGILGSRLLVSTRDDRQPNWPETLIVVAGILLQAGGYFLTGGIVFIAGMAAWLIRHRRSRGRSTPA